MITLLFQHHMHKRFSFSQNCFGTFVEKSHDYRAQVYFWAFYSFSLKFINKPVWNIEYLENSMLGWTCTLFLPCLFSWRLSALQCCGGLCHTSVWMCPNNIYNPSLLSLPHHTHSTPLGHQSIRFSSLCHMAAFC